MYKAGRQQEINFRFTRLPRLFDCKFNDEIMSEPKKKQNQKHKNKIKNKEKKKKRNSPVIINAIRQGLKNIFSQVNKNLVSLFESLPHVFTNSREKTQVSRT